MSLSAGASDRDRYDRMRRIDWVDMDGIFGSRILVTGAGALGNEVMKNLLLSGFRDITVVDMDDIVTSNLSRCVFFNDSDVHRGMKCEILAERAGRMFPDARIVPIAGRVQDIDDWHYDCVLGCLDNVSARMHVNAHCMFHKVPYVDGATDGMRGKVQTVLPGGPCLQCAMNRSHVREMERRFTCTGNGTMYVPHTASDITTTSVIAAMQVRECMKVVSGRSDLCIRNITYYDGTICESFTAELDIDGNCPNHQDW